MANHTQVPRTKERRVLLQRKVSGEQRGREDGRSCFEQKSSNLDSFHWRKLEVSPWLADGRVLLAGLLLGRKNLSLPDARVIE